MTTATRIPATIITGFLGAGKTTLLRHLIETARGKRIAIIVNEFGSVGIDGDTLRGCGIESCPEENIVELSNGCLCCTVAEDFVPTMQALIDRDSPPDHIIIETSGLALPKPLVKAFDWPSIRSRLTVDGVIAVVDAPAVAAGRFADDPEAVARQRELDPSVDHDNPLAEVYEDQLMAADLIVLNKTDLIDTATRELLSRQVAAIVPRAVKIVAAHEGRVDADVPVSYTHL
ncbi:MAG: cobalamin biosynthesis protein CobW, partial [Methyloceanibacter sp.]